MNEFHKAAQALPGHWHKGDFTDGQGNYCGVGHLLKAHGWTDENLDGDISDPTLLNQLELLHGIAREQYPDRATFIKTFPEVNDHAETTEEEAVALLEKAAVAWDERIH